MGYKRKKKKSGLLTALTPKRKTTMQEKFGMDPRNSLLGALRK